MKRILITGACGQIGSELAVELRRKFGGDNVVAADKRKPFQDFLSAGPFELVDVTNRETVEAIIKAYDIDTIYHMVAILSAVGEKNPQLCWEVNVNGLYNVLEVARKYKLSRIFYPSSIAVFGSKTPRDNTPQDAVLCPETMYGVTKATGEFLCDYYYRSFGVDVRGIRYPGIISSTSPPGGGTTDYATAMFHGAINDKRYICFVREDTILPMMYVPDCIRATMELMEADLSNLRHHSNFNLGAMSFSVGELASEIRRRIPEFICEYRPDFRQKIADSWPKSIDDSAAREEWGWRPRYDLCRMVEDMLGKIKSKPSSGKHLERDDRHVIFRQPRRLGIKADKSNGK